MTITLPDAGQRFMSMMVIDEDHYVHTVVYGAGNYTFIQRQGRHSLRVSRDPHACRSRKSEGCRAGSCAAGCDQGKPSSPGRFEVPNWDQVSQKKVRAALKALGETMPDLTNAFGTKAQVDPVRQLVATAIGWGGNPDKDAIYLNVTPTKNDGTTVYRLKVRDVPVDGFWSVSVYKPRWLFPEE